MSQLFKVEGIIKIQKSHLKYGLFAVHFRTNKFVQRAQQWCEDISNVGSL